MTDGKTKESLLPPYRVLELTDQKGELCGKLLADMGADVVKIERPGGDLTRNLGPFYKDNVDSQKSLHWFAHNSNKRGITLNLETSDGKRVFKALVKQADCIVETFPPGYMDSLGLGYDQLNRLNPRLVVTSITSFGQVGPYRDFKGCDLTIQALSGIMDANGDSNRPPVRWCFEQSYAVAGIHALAGTVIALNYRDITGQGQRVDVSVEDCMTWQNLGPWFPLHWEFEKLILKRNGNRSRRGSINLSTAYPCQDGYISWRLWTGSMGRRTKMLVDYMASTGFNVSELNGINWDVLDILKLKQEEIDRWEAAFARFFKEHTKRELYEGGAKWGFILYPVNTAGEILENPQLASQEHFISIEHPELNDTITYPGKYFNSTVTSWLLRRPAPFTGEHNRQIYRDELGLSDREVTILKEANVI